MAGGNNGPNRITILVLAGAALAAAIPRLAGAQVRILTKSGGTETATTVEKDDIDQVVYKKPQMSQTQTLKGVDVERVVWEAGPELFMSGMSLLRDGQYENAANALNRFLAQSPNAVMGAHALAQLAHAYLEWSGGDRSSPSLAKSIETAEQFLSTYPNSRLVPAVRLLLGRATTDSGDYVKAEQIFRELENDARGQFGREWEVRAKYWGAINLEKKGNFGEARNLYKSLENTARSAADSLSNKGGNLYRELKEMENTGLVSQGTCFLLEGDLDQAKRYFRDLQRQAMKDKNELLLPGAGNGLGEVLLEEGNYYEARFQFTNVYVKYASVPEETLRAIYGLGECFLNLEGKEPGARAKAMELFREVIDRNRADGLKSRWAAEAKKKM